jgi:RNA recognition motif-containing protein
MDDVRLRVNNLPKGFTGDDLYGLFKEFGKIKHVKILNEGSTYSCGQICFEKEEVGKIAMNKMDGKKICGSHIISVTTNVINGDTQEQFLKRREGN